MSRVGISECRGWRSRRRSRRRHRGRRRSGGRDAGGGRQKRILRLRRFVAAGNFFQLMTFEAVVFEVINQVIDFFI